MTRVVDPPKRLLVVEDEPFVALALTDALADLGFDVAACVGDVRAALAAIRRERIDGALLDVNLGSERIDPVAELLAERRCPFVFTTGNSEADLPPAYADRTVLQKPFGSEALASTLQGLFGP